MVVRLPRLAAGIVALAACCACARSKAPAGLPRALPRLGETTFVRLEEETRPAVLLAAGETRKVRVGAAPGSRLSFAVGMVEPPSFGFVRLTAHVGGKQAFAGRFAVSRTDHWWKRSVSLEAAGDTELELRVDHVRGDGSPIDLGDAADRRFIALASARLDNAPARPRRVFVWISQDTVRADHLGTYGYTRPTSPAFDSLARSWTVFDNAWAPASWTLPSLASQFTSRYPTYHGAVLHALPIDTASRTLFEVLAEDGFTVLGVTANDLVDGPHGLARGFHALRFVLGRAHVVNSNVDELLAQWKGGDLALFVHYMDPHHPYDPPPSYHTVFDPGYRGPAVGTDFESLRRLRARDAINHVTALYDGEIAYADGKIDDLLSHLEAKGILGDAVIAYTADHGEELLDHGMWHHGGTLYEELLHVPFALGVPGTSGRRWPQPVSLIDLAPTVLDAFGIKAPPSFQGRSLLPAIRGGTVPSVPIYAETSLAAGRQHLVAVRDGSRKAVIELPPGRETMPRITRLQLYDLALDPGEKAGRSQVLTTDTLQRDLMTYISSSRAVAPQMRLLTLDSQALERLRALGYVR